MAASSRPRGPPRSSSHAALWTSSRAPSRSVASSASGWEMPWNAPIAWPNALRSMAYAQPISRAAVPLPTRAAAVRTSHSSIGRLERGRRPRALGEDGAAAERGGRRAVPRRGWRRGWRSASRHGHEPERRSPSSTTTASHTAPAGTSSATPPRAGRTARVTSCSPSSTGREGLDGGRRRRRRRAAGRRPGPRAPAPARRPDRPARRRAPGRAATHPSRPAPRRTPMVTTPVSTSVRHSAGVEAAGLGGPHLLGRRRLGEQVGEGGDELLLLVAQGEVHGRSTVSRRDNATTVFGKPSYQSPEDR